MVTTSLPLSFLSEFVTLLSSRYFEQLFLEKEIDSNPSSSPFLELISPPRILYHHSFFLKQSRIFQGDERTKKDTFINPTRLPSRFFLYDDI